MIISTPYLGMFQADAKKEEFWKRKYSIEILHIFTLEEGRVMKRCQPEVITNSSNMVFPKYMIKSNIRRDHPI